MSFDELVQRYRTRIAASSNKKQELEKILREIDKLKYSKSGELFRVKVKDSYWNLYAQNSYRSRLLILLKIILNF